jgi:Zn-dependent peptidase ImmA (M78 family)
VITKQQLHHIAAKFAPAKYQPKGMGHLITHIDAVSRKTISGYLKLANKEDSIAGAICVDWGRLRKITGAKNYRDALGTHLILLDAELPGGLTQATFALLHEFGHVEWKTERGLLTNWKEEDLETYCDYFAFSLLEKNIGLQGATYIASLFSSKDGLGKEIASA